MQEPSAIRRSISCHRVVEWHEVEGAQIALYLHRSTMLRVEFTKLLVRLMQLDLKSAILRDRIISLNHDLGYLFKRSFVYCCALFEDPAILHAKFLL